MKLFSLIILSFITFSGFAATSTKDTVVAAAISMPGFTINATQSQVATAQKLNFLQRILLKVAIKKYKKAADINKADKQAGSALAFGLGAMTTLLLGLIIPYVIFLAIPTGIVAMVLGKQALLGGTNFPSKAKIGKTFGLVSLIGVAFILILAAIVVASWGNW